MTHHFNVVRPFPIFRDDNSWPLRGAQEFFYWRESAAVRPVKREASPVNSNEPRQHRPPVSPTHARTLLAHLKTIEEYCRDVETWLGEPQGIYFEAEGEIPPDVQIKIRAIFSEVYELLTTMRRDLGLEKVKINRFNLIQAYLSEAWASLSDTKSRHLKAYGAVAKELAEYLDPRLDKLNLMLKEIRVAAEAAKQDARSRQGD